MVQLSHALQRGSYLVHAPKRLVIWPLVSPNHMHQLVFGSCSVGTFVGEKNHGPTNAEKAIGYEHGLVVPEVPILGYVLGTDDDGVGARVNLKHVFCKVNRDDIGAAAHATKVEAFGVTAELILVDDQGGEGMGGVEEAVVDDKDADVFGVDKGEARRREMVSKKEGWSETKGRSSEDREKGGRRGRKAEAWRLEGERKKISYFFI
ncbi:hypothetical protein GmHk_06G017262 [Glycine max]|nr:hypothetical protein GYH30_016137 [Glycine max]KAH1247339.1 hypothetical protein GmHk_06G017262 [Glycine max]